MSRADLLAQDDADFRFFRDFVMWSITTRIFQNLSGPDLENVWGPNFANTSPFAFFSAKTSSTAQSFDIQHYSQHPNFSSPSPSPSSSSYQNIMPMWAQLCPAWMPVVSEGSKLLHGTAVQVFRTYTKAEEFATRFWEWKKWTKHRRDASKSVYRLRKFTTAFRWFIL